MKKAIDLSVSILIAYLATTAVIQYIRWLPMDCKKRNVDYIFPLTRLHCEVDKTQGLQ